MPELAEVEFCRRKWHQTLPFKIEEVITSDTSRVYRDCAPETVKEALTGATLTDSFRHGKQMFFQTDRQQWLNVHLGMTGFLSIKSDATLTEWKKRDALVLQGTSGWLHFDDFRMFGKVDLFPQKPTFPTPDPTSDAYDLPTFETLAQRYAKKQIKAFLLDQVCCPGFGNWMADEVMWQAGISPTRKVGQCDLEKLFKTIKWVAVQSIHYVADGAGTPMSTYKKKHAESWGAPPEGWLFQARWKKDLTCPKCDAILSRETFAGRTTSFCAQCQS